jgi:thioredoxin-dependent peroxiredoxin
MAIKKKKKTTKKKATAAKAKKKLVKKAPAKKAKSKAPAVRIGEPVPNLSLIGTTGGETRLSDLRGKKVVLYFYPRDATPGCTIEGKDFSRLLPDFEATNAEVYGISRDSLASHEKFRAKENYTVHLLSDEDETACSQFDVMKMKNMYGKQVRGVERSTFVIDQNGKLVKEWRKVNVTGHAEEVLQFVKLL